MTDARVNQELATQVRSLLGSATPASVPEGVLIWLGGDQLPNGSTAIPVLDQIGWEAAYLRIENGSLQSATVRPLSDVLAATAAFRPDGPLPVAIARFRYAAPRAALVARVRRAAEERRGLKHPPGTLEGELDQSGAFFACGLLHNQWGFSKPAYRGRRVSFLVRADFLLSNPGAPQPDDIELDLGDGGGFRKVELDVPLTAEYTEGSTASVAVRCRYGAEALTARFTVALSDVPASPVPDEEWPLRADCGNTGTAHVYRAHAGGKLRHPLIMVEGFPGGHPADYLYETLNQQNTADQLRAAGYDLVLVCLDRGTDEIQRNAGVLVACIRAAMERTQEDLVVGGMSMGGLVSRFALASMEARGEPHHTSVLLTIDTPHAGTYTSLGAQWFVHTFAPYLPALAGYARLLDSPANQQLDLWWLHDGTVNRSPLREAFVTELAALGGYPKLPRLLAVSSGRGDGARSAQPGVLTLRWSGEPWVSAELHALGGGTGHTAAERSSGGESQMIGYGHCFLAERLEPLRFDGDAAWDVAPGGQEPYTGQLAAIAEGVGCGTVVHGRDEVCTVPTISALDLRQDPFSPVPAPGSGASPFEDYACAAENEQHLTITAELSAWLRRALGSPRAEDVGRRDG
ncbi:MAG: esterase/lipase family protein [Solirubrobacteraceae bacterium]